MNINQQKPVWIINKGLNTIERADLELKRFIVFKPHLPIKLPMYIALKYIKQFRNLAICNDVEKYFSERIIKTLVIRDAGIGDLLLLEPIIRKVQEIQNTEITIATRYPEIFENHPAVAKIIRMEDKNDIHKIRISDYDNYVDIRSYSETCANRDKEHRTDIYNEKWLIDIEYNEKEPRLYIDSKYRNSLLNKKVGYDYIGISFDASHSYRRLEEYEQIINYILNIDKKNIIVLIGSYKYIDIKKNKRIIDLQKKTDIKEMFAVVRDLDYMIAVDSGIMHVALSMHIPTLCIFSIITPDFRLRYYQGSYRALSKNKLKCIYCGDLHMIECKFGSKKKDISFIPPCMKWTGKEIYDELLQLEKKEKVVFYNNGHKNKIELKSIKDIQIISKSVQKKITMPIIVLNEEHNLSRFIENVMSHPLIERTIAIDGGSTDNTVKLLKKAGAEVYVHPYIKTYFNQQAIQREISFSYVNEGTPCMFMDIDECFNQELYDHLFVLIENWPDYGLIARKTFNYYEDITDISKQIKDWPDWQPRIYNWQKKYKFINGAHHQTINTPSPIKLPLSMYVIHFEKEGKNRDEIEKQWSNMMTGVKQYA